MIELYLQWYTNRRSYIVYQMVTFLMTSNSDLEGTPLFAVEYL